MEKPAAPAAAPTRAVCAIEGDIAREADEIDQLPGSRDYDRTVIDTGSGERLLCREIEAAGWRMARG
ncbi:MAG: nuclease [Sphingomonadaceae bacterium]|uniref:nuclease n=1 Tax=Methylobacterium sp. 275MFSha3.1 TaxID=1502746 RepID=UPI0008A7F1E5|nr:nuclease [Methylobacterium sp. 275MFSha3.1]RTL14678.1 MAG: nuclease [Sphingomonadaceae bacterium]SEH28731.1 hypothetical protein SAMN02799636_00648 [Methylobacterium sp. 275MFSha3.1]